jgi:amino acid adenylation domain-containing protein
MEPTIQGFRLSPRQRAQWLTGGNRPDFVARCIVALEGDLAIESLRNAVRRVVGRHDILRTTFRSRPGLKVPLQVVGEDCVVDWRVLDNAGRSDSWSERTFGAGALPPLPAAAEESAPLHCLLIRESPGRHELVLSLPCLCADSRSLCNLVDEIARCFESVCGGDESPLGEVVQYVHVAEWQNELLAAGSDEVEKGRDVWRERAEAPGLVLPCERRAGVGAGESERSIEREVSAALWERIQAASGSAKSSTELFLLACWSALLHRLTGQREFSLFHLADGRRFDELTGTLGPLAVTVPLPLEVNEGQTFRSVLKGVEAAVVEARSWEDYLYAEDWCLGRDGSAAIGFEYQEWVPPRESAGVRFSLLRRSVRSEPSKLKLCCAEDAQGLDLRLEYDPERFTAGEMRRLLAQLESVVASACRDPEVPIAALDLLGEEERRRLLVELNDTAVVWPAEASVPSLFAEHARRAPDREALVEGERRITFGELDRRASRLAQCLGELGAGPEAVVALALERSAETVVGILGTLRAGAAYLPLDLSQPRERLRSLVEESGAVAVLTEAHRVGWLGFQEARTVGIEQAGEVCAESWEGPLPSSARPENLAYVIFTSGSTGRPKGVAVEHRQLLNYTLGILERLSLPMGSSFATVSTFAADLGNTTVFASLCGGGCLHVVPETCVSDGAAMAEYMERHGIDCLKIVPSHLEALLGAEPGQVLPLQRLVLGGEASRLEWVNRLRGVSGCTILNHYGPTEATVGVMTCEVGEAWGDPPPSAVPLGRPLANSRVYVLDESLAPSAVWVSGELYVAGAGVARGYLGRPELTAERFLPDPWSPEPGGRMYRTGDLVRHRPEGVAEFLGRVDGQVKLRGYRIEPGEIEATLRRHPSVAQAAVVAREDEPGAKRLVAYVVPQGESGVSGAELRSFLRGTLPAYMVPSVFVPLRRLPLTRNGKLDRRALPVPDSGGALREPLPPRTPFEELLSGIWAETLRVERVGVEDNFFDLGGHSLLATRVIARIRESFGVALPVRSLFDRPTVSRLAEAIAEALRAGEVSSAPPLEATARDGPLPLSFAQQRLWFLDQLAPGSSVYNIPHAVVLAGELSVPALGAAMAEVVRRHEVLRTTFATVEGEPVARVGAAEAPGLPLVDLGVVGGAAWEEARRLVRQEGGRPFDLERGPLLRLLLVRLSERTHTLASTMHHIVSDGWSTGILVRELSALYQAFVAGRESPLAELPIQYGDFAVWQRRWLSGGVLASEIAYWKGQLAGMPPVLELPTDRLRPALRRGRGAREAFALSAESLAGLRALVREQGATLFMGLLTGFAVLLGRYSGQEDLTIGTPIAGRTQVEVEKLIGFFVNTLVLRADLSGDPPFVEQLHRVREATLGAYAHQELPFERLVEELEPVRDLGRTPLFQAMLVLQNVPQESLEMEGLRLSGLELESDTAKLDLTLSMIEGGAGGVIHGSVDYDVDLFDRSTIRRLVAHLGNLLSGALAAPQTALSALPLEIMAERHQLLLEWNDTASSYAPDGRLHGLVEAQMARAPEQVAVVFEGEFLTYGSLDAEANRLASRLRRLGVGADAVVAFCAERSIEMVVGLLGILKSGGAYVPLDPTYPAERLRFMMVDAFRGAERPVLVIQEHLERRLADEALAGTPSVTVVRLGGVRDPVAEEVVSELAVDLAPENLAYLIYTSGSTGRPKGVMTSHRAIVNRLLWMQEVLSITAADRVLQKTPLSFDVSVWELFWPLMTGACLVVARPDGHRDSAYLALAIEEHEITVLHFVPSMLSVFLEEPNLGHCASLRRVIASGEGLASELAARFLSRFSVGLYNLYGPTEAAVEVTYHACRLSAGVPLPIGRPIANLEVHVVGRDLQAASLGAVGELWIGGVGLARGYLGRADLTAQAFVPHPWSVRPGERLYRTGDLVRRLADGSVVYLGRIDHQVKIRGFRIELGEIESALRGHPEVREAVVLAREDRPEERRLVAYLVADEDRLTAGELRDFLRERLPEHMVPAAFAWLEALPLTANGKVDRRALPVAEEGSGGEGREPVAPRTPFEELLAGIWAEALRAERVGVEDNFFDLGGHSLLATRVISRIREAFGVGLPVRSLFDRPTVSRLAEVIVEALRTGDVSSAPPLAATAREDPLPLSFAQQRLWFLDQLSPGSAVYNIQHAVLLTGELSVPVFWRSMAEVVRRHEVLRTTFVARGGEPVARISAAEAPALPLVDLGGLGGVAWEEVRRLARQEAERPFDLERGPLLRLALLRLSEASHALLLTMHHIVSDGWSTGVLIRELSALYAAFLASRESPLPELLIQYVDFAAWQRRWLSGEVLEGELTYWRRQLAGDLPSLRLPCDRSRPERPTHRGKRQPFDFSPAMSAAIRSLCAREASTPFMFMLAAFAVMLSRYAGQEEVVVGADLSSRPCRETEGLIGLFINMLVMRVDLSGDPTFRELLHRVREMSLGAFAHQEMPYEKLVEELRPDRSRGGAPLFQTLLNYTSEERRDVAGLAEPIGLRLSAFEREDQLVRFDLMLRVIESDGQLAGSWVYSCELFEPSTIARLHDRFMNVVGRAVARPEVTLAEIEREMVIEEVRGRNRARPGRGQERLRATRPRRMRL